MNPNVRVIEDGGGHADDRTVNGYMTSERHLSAGDVAAYLDGAIGDADRERIERHAAECDVCRREIAEVTVALRQERKTPSWRIWVPAAAAAVVAVLLVQPFGPGTGPDGTSRLRGPAGIPDREGAVAIRIIAPSAESVVASGQVAFIWQAAGAGTSYQLTLTDDEGSVLWTLATTDTVAQLPDTIELDLASRYHWYVDAMLDDGQSRSSGVHSFTTGR